MLEDESNDFDMVEAEYGIVADSGLDEVTFCISFLSVVVGDHCVSRLFGGAW